tara:strand:- start:2 stop:1039 length:1038 start_codon:yes stop_codon:yes gene_type:complete
MRGGEPQAFEQAAAWLASEFTGKDDLAVDLERRHIEALEAETARAMAAGLTHADLSPASFPLAALGDDIVVWRRKVQRGRGIILLRGFPVQRHSVEELRLMFLGLGSHFGRPVSQSKMGDLVGDVIDVGGKDKRERAYRNSRELKLHTDRCDHLGMLCIRPAAEGGLSGYASALAIHNAMLRERPDLLALLYRGYFHHRFGEQAPGEPPVTAERIPIFSVADGVPSVIYIRGYIDLAVEEGHTVLSEAESEALDYLDDVCNRPEIRLDFMMAPGEATFTNNCLLLHTRTAFEDAEDAAQKRHLLRLWLREDDRPMAPGVLLHKGTAGIPPREDKSTYYKPVSTTG